MRTSTIKQVGLSVMAVLVSALIMGSAQSTAAFASVVQSQVAEVKVIDMSQSLTVSAVVQDTPTVSRAEYSVTMVDVVQNPVPEGTRAGNGYGWLSNPCDGCSSFHKGVDLFAGNGNPVLTIAKGVVTQAGFMGTLGLTVTVESVVNGQVITSMYGHLSQVNVSQGQPVNLSTVVGLVGQTGAATAPLLNFTVFVGGQVVDPQVWLANNVNASDWNV